MLRDIGPDLLSAAECIAARGGELGCPLHIVSTTTSTSDLAKQGARAGANHGSTWLAEEQTDGRGRQGRQWFARRGESLLFSVLLRLDCDLCRLPPVSVGVGLAVADAIGRHLKERRPRLKWPNDVVIRDRKVAGILVESVKVSPGKSCVIVGIGINVHTRHFQGDLDGRATSLALETGQVPSRAELLADVIEQLDRDVPLVVGHGLGLFAARIAECDSLRGRTVRSVSGDEGTAEGIGENGCLLVRRVDGQLAHWSSGEVHLVGLG